MTPTSFRWAMRHAPTGLRHLGPGPRAGATGAVARVHAALEREFGLLAPPIALHSPHPDLLAAAWVLLRETLLVPGDLPRAEREAVAAGVSLANACPYCVQVHGAVLGGVRGDRAGRADAAALAADRIGAVGEPGARALAAWARSGGTGPPPVPGDQVAEVLGVALVFQYLNRMVTVFLGDSPLPASLPARAAAPAAALLGRVLAATARRPVVAGTDLDLLPAAPLPADLGWAAGRPDLSAALARGTAAVDRAGSAVLGPAVRAAVTAAVLAHDGRPPREAGPGWLGPVLADLPPEDRAAARLAAFTALTPHRVGDSVVEEFRSARPAPADLLAVTSWAALTAARRTVAAPAPPRW
jgi:AhpD family alkylhydroperoxidase